MRQYENWREPPTLTADDGAPRRLGVELEFIGPSVAAAAGIVRDRFGGAIEPVADHRSIVADTRLGDFTVELDMKFAHPVEDARPILDAEFDRKVRSLVGSVASTLVPIEIVCPPVPMTEAAEIGGLIDDLRSAQAGGAGDGLLAAYGAQLNPEASSLTADSLLRHMQSFALLQEWLFAATDVQLSRRLLGFAQPYAAAYRRRLLAPGYAPRLETLIDDYIAANPTRNRALDMLPMFRALDEERVVRALPYETINARPTFHYRLPNMNLSDESWSLGLEWSRWVSVEKLAARPDALEAVAEQWRKVDASLTGDWRPTSAAVAALL